MLVNGIPQTQLALTDRALSYGDGLFETVRLYQGRPIFLTKHLMRLQLGCERLGIECQMDLLQKEIAQLENQFNAFGVLKIIVSRGSGGRGYRPAQSTTRATTHATTDDDTAELINNQTTRILTLHSLPDYTEVLSQGGINTFLCTQRLGFQPALAGIKHLNRLEQVMASLEWPSEDYFEGIMLDLDGYVIEGTKSNIFFAEGGKLFTPELSRCGVNGVLRQALLEHFKDQLTIEACALSRLITADEVFVGNSVFGVLPVLKFKDKQQEHYFTPADFCQQAQQVFNAALTAQSQDKC